MKTYYCIDSFCGAGGMSLGFQSAGFCIACAFDHDPASIATYKRNLGDHAFTADAHDVDGNWIKEHSTPRGQRADVLIGGPPCQGFSVQRRGADIDPRNDLVKEFSRIVDEVRPRFFVMENVVGLLSSRGDGALSYLRKSATKSGYILHQKKLDAYEYGIPQHRKRVIIVGEQLEGPFVRFAFPRPPESYIRERTVRSWIGDLQSLSESDIPNHRADRLSPTNLERIRSLKAGQDRTHLPKHLQLSTHQKNPSHRHLDVYSRMSWDLPARTITARFDSFSRGQFGHPVLDRSITLREGARLQTFPDTFTFAGTKVEVARQIGNAVPPMLATAIAQQIFRCLNDTE